MKAKLVTGARSIQPLVGVTQQEEIHECGLEAPVTNGVLNQTVYVLLAFVHLAERVRVN